jgi:hypothetical protein
MSTCEARHGIYRTVNVRNSNVLFIWVINNSQVSQSDVEVGSSNKILTSKGKREPEEALVDEAGLRGTDKVKRPRPRILVKKTNSS